MHKSEDPNPSGDTRSATRRFVMLLLMAYAIAIACLAWAYGITSHFQRVQNADALWSSPRAQEYEDIAIR